jgi:iron complex outermembrane receptor protein
MKKTPLAGAISSILTAGALCATPLTFAQEQDEEALAAVEEVVVTGSRIRKDVFTSSTPLDVIDVEEASITGIANVGQLLQANTVALGSPQVTSASSFQFVENGGLGTSTISLRGLGANRTLVLLNGRRAGPSGIKGGTSSFDLNVMPLATIERVEILKDGASSIYGSDAVAGVVNIITKKEDGGTFDVFTSVPEESGGEETRITGSWGKTFDRGNFRVTADYSKRAHLRRGERDYFTCGNQFIFDQNTGERADIVDPRTGEYACEDLTWGHVWIYDYADPTNVPSSASLLSQFDYEGDNLGDHIPGYAAPTTPGQLTQPGGFFPVAYDRLTDGITNDDHPFQNRESLNPQTELMTVYAEAEYNLTDDTTLYSEFLFNRRETEADGYRQYWSYIYTGDFDWGSLGTGTPGGGSELSAAAGWFGEQWLSPTAITDHNDSSAEIDYMRFVAGLRGSLNEAWDWDVSFQYSDSDASYTDDRIYADSIFDNNFATSSCVGTVSSVRGAPCVDVPWLDPELLRGNISDDVRGFLFGTETGTTTYEQWSIDGYVSGEAFNLPAGTVGHAYGFHYREDKMKDTPGTITYDPTTGEGNSWLDDAAGITEGKDTSMAFFAEVDVPLLADKPGIKFLNLNASARYTDVDSYGSDTTWKLGLNWQVTDSLRVRANQGTSFRTPALYELYLADQTSSISQRTDPCRDYTENFALGLISPNVFANCEADPRGLPADYTGGTITPTVFTGGGFGVLEAETSDSSTIGFIWQPDFADLSISLDYFDIEVNNEVDQLGGAAILLGCYESNFGYAFGGTEPLCDLFDRTSVNFGPDNIRDSFINIAEQKNRGYDLQVRYSTDISWGHLMLEVDVTKQVEDVQALFTETPEDFNGLVGDPEWVGETRLTLVHDDWQFFWGMNYIGDSSNVEKFGRDYVIYRDVNYDAVLSTDTVIYHHLSASYQMDNGLQILAGVANVLDEEPPQLTRAGVGTDQYTMVGNSLLMSQYDPLGRRFFLNLTKTWD